MSNEKAQTNNHSQIVLLSADAPCLCSERADADKRAIESTGKPARLIKLSFICLIILLVICTTLTYAIHGPRTCSDATGYMMGATSLKLHNEYNAHSSDDELIAEGMTFEFDCPKNATDLAIYKSEKPHEPQVRWAVGYPFLVSVIARLPFMTVSRAFCLLHFLCTLAVLANLCAWCKLSPCQWNISALALLTIFFSTFLWLLNMVPFSENLFLPLSLWALYCLHLYGLSPQKKFLLFFAAILTGYGILTRYAGLYQIPAAICILYMFSKHNIKRFLGNSVVFSIISFLPFCAWQLRNYYLTGHLRGTRITSSDYWARIADLYSHCGSWLFPLPAPLVERAPYLLYALRFIPVLFLVFYFTRLWRKRILQGNASLKFTQLMIYAVTYFGFTLITLAVTGEPYPFDFRVMLPMLAPGCIALIILLNQNTQDDGIDRLGKSLLFTSASWNAVYCLAFLTKQLLCAWGNK